ncbi:Hypothetical_protein [Hexamita inflata]|uniref:Hypothetical_protein n=1 Tax=Hexamita inflata TaxID=28002 RepID=A0ABP1GE35_9EUKA
MVIMTKISKLQYVLSEQYHQVFALLLIFPYFVPFSNFDEEITFQLTVASYQLQLKYHDILADTAQYAVNVGQQKRKNKDYKTFLDVEMLNELIAYTVSLIFIMTNYSNVNSFCASSSPCECYFGRLKKQCGTDLCTTHAIQVAKSQQLVAHINDQVQVIDNMKYRQKEYCRVIVGNHKNFQNVVQENKNFVRCLFNLVYNKKLLNQTPENQLFSMKNHKNCVQNYLEKSMISEFELLANYRHSSTLCYNYSSIACTVRSREKMIQEACNKKKQKSAKQ